ncbi:uncharacterized protein LOC118763691 [Octopus sinensis]|uniref:Uncharacterized protein LOC118763691 n=1 Tax=Octopus sinensis TaxID=2607531 RepID=A0A7E6EUN7_9MOLL|nr:uncharacterized protein LOC118763691 [Octopus sinensis]
MTRLFPFYLLFLTAVTALEPEEEKECDGCLIEGKCRKYEDTWMEKTEIMCALKTCHRMSDTQWKVYAKSVYCRKNNGNCVKKDKVWSGMEDGVCWVHRCNITGSNRVQITSRSGGKCVE